MPIAVKRKLINLTLPNEELGIVLMQPYIELVNSSPFKWITSNSKKANQISAISKTLDIAKANTHGQDKTHFTLFPEYSIPGLEGIETIDAVIRSTDWNNGTIVIGGIDALTKSEYTALCSSAEVEVDDLNKPSMLGANEWVNCCITWVKDDNGNIKKFIQLKCFKSLLEDHLRCGNLFEGKYVNLFECLRSGLKFRFLSVICYDWIGITNQQKFIWYILNEVHKTFNNSRQELDMLFVLQHNLNPNHSTFMENARDFFEEAGTCQGVIRDKTILVFANSAGGPTLGKFPTFGSSSFIYSSCSPFYVAKCEQTYATYTKKLRGNGILNRCKDNYLREGGICIHSAHIILPQTLNLGQNGRRKHLHVKVHPITNITDKRTPDDEVPASTKWLNDTLDKLSAKSYNVVYNHPVFGNTISSNHNNLISQIRFFDDDRTVRFVESSIFNLLLWNSNGKTISGTIFEDRIIHNEHMVDHWDNKEEDEFKEILHLLSILKLCFTIRIENELYHCSILCKGTVFNLLFVSRIANSKDAFDEIRRTFNHNNNSIIILVMKSEDVHLGICNTIYQVIDYSKLPDITDPTQNIIPVSIIEILNVFRNSKNIDDLKKNLLNLIKYEC